MRSISENSNLSKVSTDVSIHVVLDANAICSNFKLTSRSRRALIEASKANLVTVHVSEVVISEVKRQFVETLKDALETAKKSDFLGKTGRLGIDTGVDLQSVFKREEGAYPNYLDQLCADANFVREPISLVQHEDLVARDLEIRKPFKRTKDGSVGYRDALIWHGILDIAKRFPNERVFFVSENVKDFSVVPGKKSDESKQMEEQLALRPSGPEFETLIVDLAPNLVDDVRAICNGNCNVLLIRNIDDLYKVVLSPLVPTEVPGAAAQLKATFSLSSDGPITYIASSPEATPTSPVKAILIDTYARADILNALNDEGSEVADRIIVKSQTLDDDDLTGTFVVDLELPEWVELGSLWGIEEPSDFVIVEIFDEAEGKQTISTEHSLELNFYGYISKSDYYLHDTSEFQLDDADYNEHTVEVSYTTNVVVESDVELVKDEKSIASASATLRGIRRA